MAAVIAVAVVRPAAGFKQELIDGLRSAIPAVHSEPGCLLYAIHEADDGGITLIEKWDSPASAEAHGTGPAIQAVYAAIGSYVAGPALIKYLTPIPAGTPAQGEL